MQKATSAETVGLTLLGVGVFTLALLLHDAQPGALGGLPLWWVWPAGALGIYAAGSLIHAGPRPTALLTFGAALVAHLTMAALMALAFGAQAGRALQYDQTFLAAGLWAYPPAVLLQIAFALPCAVALTPGRFASAQAEASAEALARADTPEQLLAAVIALRSSLGDSAEPAIARVAEQAATILRAGAAPLPSPEPVAEPETGHPAG
jgi:hypothetical protein